MNTIRTTAKRFLTLLLAAVMVMSCVSLAEPGQAAERGPEDYVFTDYGMGYHLTSFLNGYNVLAFGSAHCDIHLMGAVLVQGIFAGGPSASGFADGENLPPSYIKGYLESPAVYCSRNSTTNGPLYVGSDNTVTATTSWGHTYYAVNGIKTKWDGSIPVYVSDNFFNFDEAYAIIKSNQQTMASRGQIVAPDADGMISVNVGDNVIIESLTGVSGINIIGDLSESVNTTISVMDHGNIVMPPEYTNGGHPSVVEQSGSGTAVVFNFPNAATIKLPTQNWLGHVIAPDADVKQDSGNFNGTIICDDLFTAAEGHIYNYNTDTTSWDVVFSLEKVWEDGNNADGIRPASIQVQLLANGEPTGPVVTITAADGWYHLWDDLPEKDSSGNRITYSAREVNVPAGYTSEYHAETQTLINTHEYETISISGNKYWWGEYWWGNRMRPQQLTLHLYANGEEVAVKTLPVDSNPSQSFTFSDLPKYQNGQEIVYTIHEDSIASYIGTTGNQDNGYSISNTWGGESIEIWGDKVWDDANNADGLRTTSITVELLADGEPVEEHIVNAKTGWAFTFTNLPKYRYINNDYWNPVEIIYTIREKAVPDGYTATITGDMTSGFTVTNTHKQDLIDLHGSKTWDDDNNNDRMRPDQITVILLANQVEVDRQTVTAANNWSWSFTDKPKNYGGKPVHYTVTEVEVPGYTPTTNEMDLTNTHVNETVEVSGAKTWQDEDNAEGLRPASITINLLRDGARIDQLTVTEDDGWAWAFTDLPKYKDGHEYVYTITEEPVAHYTTTVEGYDVINSRTVETVSVSGVKTWNDANNQDGKRPTSITINLLKNGTLYSRKIITAAENWQWNFTNLPKFENGVEITYTITEEPVAGYTTLVNGYDVVNSYTTETTSVSGVKTWNDANNQDGKRPASITISLLADNVVVAARTVTAADNWQWSFTDLPKFKDGVEIVYTITEEPVPGYTAVVSGYNVENSYTTEMVNVSGVKTWNDANNQDGKRPASITIHLLADGVEVATKIVTAADGWQWNFTDLPKFKDGAAIVYTITEDPVARYTTTINGYDVINAYTTETTGVEGSKTWDDADNQDGKRPERITIRLYADGVEIDAKAVTAADGWSWSFQNLPKYRAGQMIIYTISEDPVPGYTTVMNGFDVTNSYTTETIDLDGWKEWEDEDNAMGVRPESIIIRLLANGEEVRKVVVTEKDGWAWFFEGLPMYANGEEIEYTITEDHVKGYSTTIDGFMVVNTLGATDFSITKVWEGTHGGSIELTLFADGEVMDPQPPYTQKGDVYIWEELPLYGADGHTIVYSAKETFMENYLTIYDNVYPYEEESDAVYNGGIIINRSSTNVFVRKVWTGLMDNQTPPPIQLELYCNGKKVDRATPEVNKHGWYCYYNLPAMVNGRPAVYTVKETSMNAYMAVYTDPSGEMAESGVPGGTITNHRIPQTSDPAQLLLWTLMVLVSGAGLMWLASRRRRV